MSSSFANTAWRRRESYLHKIYSYTVVMHVHYSHNIYILFLNIRIKVSVTPLICNISIFYFNSVPFEKRKLHHTNCEASFFFQFYLEIISHNLTSLQIGLLYAVRAESRRGAAASM